MLPLLNLFSWLFNKYYNYCYCFNIIIYLDYVKYMSNIQIKENKKCTKKYF